MLITLIDEFQCLIFAIRLWKRIFKKVGQIFTKNKVLPNLIRKDLRIDDEQA